MCHSKLGAQLEKARWCAEEDGICLCKGRVIFGSFDGFMNKESVTSYAAKDAWGGSMICS